MLDAIKQAGSVDPTVVKAKLDQPGAQFNYAAINNGIATFGSAASDSVLVLRSVPIRLLIPGPSMSLKMVRIPSALSSIRIVCYSEDTT